MRFEFGREGNGNYRRGQIFRNLLHHRPAAAIDSKAYQRQEKHREEDEGCISDGLGGVETLGIEAELNLMLACRNDNGAEDVISTQDLSRFTVDGTLPARIVDVREHSKTLAVSLSLESESVGLIGGEEKRRLTPLPLPIKEGSIYFCI